MASSTEITHDFPPFIRVYKDGRVERLFATPRLPPSTDPVTGVQSKDVVISPELDVKSRIFLPKVDPGAPPQKLPLIIYVHGGGFCIGSPLNIITQGFLTPLVSQTPAVAVAIGYRLARSTLFQPHTTTAGRRSSGSPPMQLGPDPTRGSTIMLTLVGSFWWERVLGPTWPITLRSKRESIRQNWVSMG
ncbi:putative carboxylesterase [Helianthus annuus]|nr:putative carboxylesterase [Helianthus annuus]